MGGGGFVGFMQNLFTLLTGPLGIAIIGIFLVKGILQSMKEHRLGPVENALMGGGAFYAVAWFMATVLPGGG